MHASAYDPQDQTLQSPENSLSVDPAGIAPIARCPYPIRGGIVNFLLSPMHISSSPSSHLQHRTVSKMHNVILTLRNRCGLIHQSLRSFGRCFFDYSMVPTHHRFSSPPFPPIPFFSLQRAPRSTHPLMTIPFPTVKLNGWPRL